MPLTQKFGGLTYKLRIMKNIFIFLLIVALFSCKEETPDLLSSIKPGYSADFGQSTGTIVVTRSINPIDVAYNVDINLKVAFSSFTEIKKIVITKNLFDFENNKVASGMVCDTLLLDTINYAIESEAELFEGMDFEADSIYTGFYFIFESFAVIESGDTLKTATSYMLTPDYINFCDLPNIPVGIFEANNQISGFKKDVELQQGIWVWEWIWNGTDWYEDWVWHAELYLLTDFGLDWCNWNDWWYGVAFSINCPKPGDSRYVIELSAVGMDTGDDYTMIDRATGSLTTKKLRIMPYVYQDDSPDIGYFDAANNKLIFENVKVDDTWWHADKHTIEKVTFTYKSTK